MGTPMAFTSGTTYTYTDRMFKRGTIGLNLPATLASGYNWWNGVDVTSSQYLIYSDTYTTGIATQANSRPTAWTTPDKTDASLLNLINTLPERIGQTTFSNVTDATTWLQESNRYFLINSGYENIVTDQLLINVDANWYNSYKTGDTTWYDISGNFNNATLTNGPSFDTRNGGSLVFDGADDYGNFGDISYNRSNFSVFAWINYPTTHPNWDSTPVSKWYTGGGNGSGNEWSFGADGQVGPSPFAATVQYAAGGSNYISVVGGPIYSANTWYNLGFTWTGGTLSLYVNGVMVASGYTANSSAQTTTQPLTIATFYNLTTYKTNVKIGNILMYNKALSQAEILKNYNAQKGRYGYDNFVSSGLKLNLNSQIPLSYSGGGNSWYDLSGNNNTGTLTNGPTFDSTTRSIVFDGADDYVLIPYHPTTANTVSIWVKPNSSNNMDIFGDEVSYAGCGLQIMNGKYMVIASGYPLQYDRWNLNAAPSLNKFDNVVIVFKSTTVETYVNGVADIGRNQTLYPGVYMNFGIGDSSNGGYDMADFSGRVSNFMIHNRTLSATEVLQNYYQGNVVTSGLVLALDAGNLVSYDGTGTSWKDLTTNGNNGTLVNGTSYSTLNGGTLVFDGVDDYVTTTITRGALGNNMSVEAFFKYTGTDNRTYSAIIGGYESNGSGTEFFLGKNSGNTYFGIQDGNYRSDFVTTNYVFDGNYHHIVYTYNNGTGTLFIDGVQRGQNSFTKCNDSEILYIGNEVESSGYYWPGSIPVVRFYNKVLSDMEIQQNFNAHRGRYGI